MRCINRPVLSAASVLYVAGSSLAGWNHEFDDNMNPLIVPEKRGKTSKVTVDTVKLIIEKAGDLKSRGKRIRMKQFTANLKKENGIVLSSKTVNDILIANDIIAADTRKRRPKFYQSICKRIPNGLLSLDGSEFTVWLDNEAFKFNVELAVDVTSFTHTAFSIGETETTHEVIKVLEAHRKVWGTPVGIICDSGRANLSENARTYIKSQGIELVPAGPANPKGNGTDEGAFSQIKKTFGTMRLDTSSPKALAKSFLEALVSLYINMRNRLSLHGRNVLPMNEMKSYVSEEQRNLERHLIKEHKNIKAGNNENQQKLDRLHWIVRYHGLKVEAAAFKRAEYTIKFYQLKAITKTEKAFLEALNRNSDRKNLSYFFGILKNIQQQMDDDARKEYCRERYNHEVMLELERRKETQQDTVSIDHIVGMLEKAVSHVPRFIKDLAIRKAGEWTCAMSLIRIDTPMLK